MANGKFNRGSSESGRQRDGSRLPGQSAGEGTSGNVIPRPTTTASIRRGQALLRILNDKQPNGLDFSRGTTKGGVRRNFAMMANMSTSTAAQFSVEVVAVAQTFPSPTYSGLIEFDSANYDPNGMWSPPEKIICQSDGTYSCEYTITIAPRADSTNVDSRLNGAVFSSDSFAAGVETLSGSFSVPMVSGDELTLLIVGAGAFDVVVIDAVFSVTKN